MSIPFQLFTISNDNKINKSLCMSQDFHKSQILRNGITGSDCIVLGTYCQIVSIYFKSEFLNGDSLIVELL